MNNTSTRRANGEGSIYDTIQKIKRAKKLNHECNICKNCTDRSLCNNRAGTNKCQKCIECTESQNLILIIKNTYYFAKKIVVI